jgi:hypothetical protein
MNGDLALAEKIAARRRDEYLPFGAFSSYHNLPCGDATAKKLRL